MRKLSRLIPLFVVAVMVITAAISTRAQESGGVIIEGNFGGDPKNLNPLIGERYAPHSVSSVSCSPP